MADDDDRSGKPTTSLPVADAQAKLVANEQAKLSAAWLNTLAAASIVVGFVTPVAGVLYGVSRPNIGIVVGMVLAVAFFGIGVALHLYARRVLEGLLP